MYTTTLVSSLNILTEYIKVFFSFSINHFNQVTSQFENGVEASCFLAFKRAREKKGNKSSLSKEFSDHIVCLSLFLHHGHFCY